MKLDEWMKRHREDFDHSDPPEGLWNEIKEAVPSDKSTKRYWQWSAAAIILISAGLWFINGNEGSPATPKSELPSQFLAQEEMYRKDLQMIESQINLDSIADNPDYNWVFEELAELEKINSQYRSDLDAPVPQEELLSVLIDYYEKRLRLLHRLKMELKRNEKLIENENISL